MKTAIYVTGTETMTQLVLLPGLNNTHGVFDGLLAALPASVTTTALDNPTLTSVEAIARALLPLLPKKFWLGGFSLGGYIALAMLELAPERIEGLALICSGPLADTPAQLKNRAESIKVAQAGGYLPMIATQSPNSFHPDSLKNPALMAARMAMVESYGVERFIAHTTAIMNRQDRCALLDGRVPVAVIHASHDNVFPPAAVEAYAAAIPNVYRVLIHGAGHLAPMEKPAELAAALVDWIQQQES